jgi:hypothetical protein
MTASAAGAWPSRFGAGGQRRRRVRIAGTVAVLALVGLVAFVLVWFQPQKLVIDDRVDEAPPAAEVVAPGASPATAAPAVRTLSAAPFRSHEHATAGRARVIELPGRRRFVRFEGFRTSNGPLLRCTCRARRPTAPAARSTTASSLSAR